MKKSSNINRVQSLVVSNLLNAGVDTSRLVEFLNSNVDNTDEMLRVALYLNGSLDKDDPKHAVVDKDGRVRVLTNYDFFRNYVYFTVEFETTRWFASEEDAQRWASESKPYAYSGNSKETSAYKFPASAKVIDTGSCDFDTWESMDSPTIEQLQSLTLIG